MTNIPTRASLSAIGSTYGQVRTALGDLRDAIAESIGTSGGYATIPNATLLSAVKIGVRTNTPGADLQVYGSLAVSASSTAVTNLGDGNMYLQGILTCGTQSTDKIYLYPGYSIGIQEYATFYRVPIDCAHMFYAGGTHAQQRFNPGTNGVELLRLSDGEFKYKGQTIYHSGNGSFLRKDAEDTATQKINFNNGARIEGGNVSLSPNSRINFDANNGVKINLFDASNYNFFKLGIQDYGTLYIRTADRLNVYSQGDDQTSLSPGNGGATMLEVTRTVFNWMGNGVLHTGNTSNYLQKTSQVRPGVTKLYRDDIDATDYLRFYYIAAENKNRLQVVVGSGATQPLSIDYADYALKKSGTNLNLLSETSANRPGITRVWLDNSDENLFFYPYKENGYTKLNTTYGQTVADRAFYADNVGSVNGGAIASGTVGVSKLSKAQGNINVTIGSNPMTDIYFGVHQFTFASPYVSTSSGSATVSMMTTGGSNHMWVANPAVTRFNTVAITWDYLTGSGNPYTWIIHDDIGNILSTWDAEDPHDEEFPEVSPVSIDGKEAIKISLPTVTEIKQLLQQVDRANLPGWLAKSKYKGVKNPRKLFTAILKNYAGERKTMTDYTESMDLNEFVEDLPGDDQKRAWRRQAIMRAASRILTGETAINLGTLINKYYRVNTTSKTLELK